MIFECVHCYVDTFTLRARVSELPRAGGCCATIWIRLVYKGACCFSTEYIKPSDTVAHFVHLYAMTRRSHVYTLHLDSSHYVYIISTHTKPCSILVPHERKSEERSGEKWQEGKRQSQKVVQCSSNEHQRHGKMSVSEKRSRVDSAQNWVSFEAAKLDEDIMFFFCVYQEVYKNEC